MFKHFNVSFLNKNMNFLLKKEHKLLNGSVYIDLGYHIFSI